MEDRKVIEAFSEEQVSRLTGVSVRQLRYWDSDGFFSPSLAYVDHSVPFGRLYSFRDIVALKVLNTLRNDANVSLQHLREVKDRLLALSDKLWGETTLYIHNKRVAFENPETEVLEEIVSGQALLRIPLKIASADMRKAVQRLHERDSADIGRLEKKRNVASNQLVIAGTRIPVANVQAFADAGYSVDKIKAEYPTLTEADINAAINAKAA